MEGRTQRGEHGGQAPESLVFSAPSGPTGRRDREDVQDPECRPRPPDSTRFLPSFLYPQSCPKDEEQSAGRRRRTVLPAGTGPSRGSRAGSSEGLGAAPGAGGAGAALPREPLLARTRPARETRPTGPKPSPGRRGLNAGKPGGPAQGDGRARPGCASRAWDPDGCVGRARARSLFSASSRSAYMLDSVCLEETSGVRSTGRS